jgi:hypothetical protein
LKSEHEFDMATYVSGNAARPRSKPVSSEGATEASASAAGKRQLMSPTGSSTEKRTTRTRSEEVYEEQAGVSARESSGGISSLGSLRERWEEGLVLPPASSPVEVELRARLAVAEMAVEYERKRATRAESLLDELTQERRQLQKHLEETQRVLLQLVQGRMEAPTRMVGVMEPPSLGKRIVTTSRTTGSVAASVLPSVMRGKIPTSRVTTTASELGPPTLSMYGQESEVSEVEAPTRASVRRSETRRRDPFPSLPTSPWRPGVDLTSTAGSPSRWLDQLGRALESPRTTLGEFHQLVQGQEPLSEGEEEELRSGSDVFPTRNMRQARR